MKSGVVVAGWIIVWVSLLVIGLSAQEPPRLTEERVFAQLGRCQARAELQDEYIANLKAKIAELEKK